MIRAASLALLLALLGPGAVRADTAARVGPAVVDPETREAVAIVYAAREHLGRHDPVIAELSDAVEAARRLALAASDTRSTAPTRQDFEAEAAQIRSALTALPMPAVDDRRHAAVSAIHDRSQSILGKLDAAAIETDPTALLQRAAELLVDIESDRRVRVLPPARPTLVMPAPEEAVR